MTPFFLVNVLVEMKCLETTTKETRTLCQISRNLAATGQSRFKTHRKLNEINIFNHKLPQTVNETVKPK